MYRKQKVDGLVDPKELGLLILSRYAQNLRHITIGGISCITYDLRQVLESI
ncbi:hypothetical protein JCM31598_09820 [Desulfonatronum parangueonense]